MFSQGRRAAEHDRPDPGQRRQEQGRLHRLPGVHRRPAGRRRRQREVETNPTFKQIQTWSLNKSAARNKSSGVALISPRHRQYLCNLEILGSSSNRTISYKDFQP